jgi:hypothetical protein
MLVLSILHHYLLWHYGRAFGEILHVAKNLYWFVYNFFSLKQLLRSFLSPWKRMTEERGDTFSFEDLASFVIIGLISRLVGMILRSVIIIAGVCSLILLTLGVILTFVFWIGAPLLLVLAMYFGFMLLFS